MHRARTILATRLLALFVTTASTVAALSAGTVRFDEFAPTTFSVVTPDVGRLAAAWADLLGITAPPVNRPEVVYPPVFEGDRAGRPTMVTVQMANMTLSMHQPPEGRNYWRQTLEAQGQALYRMNFRVHDLADQVAYFEGKGGTLVVGDPAKVPYVNMNLWSRYGIALELNGVAADAPAQMPARPTPPAGSFAANPVVKIAFVVPDLNRAIADYADLFGLRATSAVRATVKVPRAGASGTTRLKRATLTFPNGVLLELNEPEAGPGIWQEHLRRHGRSIFSVGFRVPDLTQASAYLASKGGTLAFGGGRAAYAGFDFRATLGAVIEIQP